MVMWVVTVSDQRLMLPEEALALQGWCPRELGLAEDFWTSPEDYKFWMHTAGNAFHGGSIGAAMLLAIVALTVP
jgi:hypothetical protein